MLVTLRFLCSKLMKEILNQFYRYTLLEWKLSKKSFANTNTYMLQ